MSGKRDSDPRPRPWQGRALPTELFPQKDQKRLVKRRRLELPRNNFHYPLKVARLPIPPPLHHKIILNKQCAQNRTRTCTSWNTRTWNVRVYQFRHLGNTIEKYFQVSFIQNVRAENGTRTRDPDLGKVVLYQLSYFRLFLLVRSISLNAVQRYGFFWNSQNFSDFFFKQKTAYEMRISDWSSDVCSSDLSMAALPPSLSGMPACGATC